MKEIINPYTVRGDAIKAGDVFVLTVAIHVNRMDSHGRPMVRAYRCPYPNPQVSADGIPQGDQISEGRTMGLVEALVPTLSLIGAKVDL